MATFAERKQKNGTVKHLAQIVRRKFDYTESQTFDSLKKAKAWAKKREAEIDSDIAAGISPMKREDKRATLGDAIDKYIAKDRKGMGKTKKQVLETIKEYDIADMQCDQITSADIANFADKLWDRPGLESAATVDNYLQHLSAVFSVARVLWKFPLDEQAMRDAMTATAKLGVRGRSEKRDRRPTLEELDKIMGHFERAFTHAPRSAPMHIIVAFAIFSTRRQGEICRITWKDYEPDEEADHTRVMVRDLKHPGDKKGNDTWCTLPEPCRDIIAAIKKTDKRIFPYHPDTISRRFTEACHFLGIHDLRFHDLRHEGTSRLFEMGWNVDRVADVTGHRSWDSLKRYRQYRRKGDRYENWNWIEAVT